ncbi:MAG: FAD-dependent oxidoreductase [Coriobacteriales bacterium]|jgi:tRNA U34 5-carboxymethylaminomethyl modifying enzyme MnmG/GidA|nr:FAD-dependent oxidoreductase [Coriobacteriales bacterium]
MQRDAGGTVVVVGGGWAGCAAALAAAKTGAQVTLLERSDMLLGTGLVGGIMRNNGRFTATEESIALGGGELFALTDANARHTGIDFPSHRHASLYDIATTPGAVERLLKERGVAVVFRARVNDVLDSTGSHIESVTDDAGIDYSADVFIDTTGTAGPMPNCIKYGNGCAMCVLRCPSFGGRVSVVALAGIVERQGSSKDGSLGAMSGSCKLHKESLAPDIVAQLETTGVAVVPLPEQLVENHLDKKACQQYATAEFAQNLVLLDTGHAKLMTPFYNLDTLHQVPGFQNARYEDPYAGGKGNSMRYFALAPRDDSLKVEGIDNLFCAGEKAGLLVGHTEAIVTGTHAGYNAARLLAGHAPVVLPTQTVIGDAITWVRTEMDAPGGLSKKYTFSGSVLFERMKEQGSYTTDVASIKARIEALGLSGLYKDVERVVS